MTSRNVIGVCNLGSLFSHVLHTAQKLNSNLGPRGLPTEGTAGPPATKQITSANVRTTILSGTSVSSGCRTAAMTDNGLEAMSLDRGTPWAKTPEETAQTLCH